MAPILKESHTPVAATAASAPSSPVAKSPNETPSRPQPVAVEIPVAINGARTVGASDKREPFSETTQTVLVFSHGAVVRVITPLAPGQLVFLTNEKTKKEVVCQVMKSKSGGSTGAYVELQFTEPAPGFWGLRMPSASSVPAAPAPSVSRPAAPVASKVTPPPPVAAKPLVAEPVVPAVAIALPAKRVSSPPPPHVAKVEPAPKRPSLPESSTSVVSGTAKSTPAPAESPVPVASNPPVSSPALRDYSKDVVSLFAAPAATTNELPSQKPTEEHTAPPPSTSSSDALKLQAARLQEQLGSLLFTEPPAAPPAPSGTPATPNALSPVTEIAQKVAEISSRETVDAPKLEPKTAVSVRKPVTPVLAASEEVHIPAWLAPLSQNSEPSAAEPADSTGASFEPLPEGAVGTEGSSDSSAQSSHRSQAAVFGGQLLGESSLDREQAAPTGSKKGLLIGLAATLILVGAGAWYYRQNPSFTLPFFSAQPARVQAPSEPVSISSIPAASDTSTPATTTESRATNSSAQVSSQPAKSTATVATPLPAAAVPQAVDANSSSRTASAAEPPKKPTINGVHLAAPVVNRSASSQDSSLALPSIDTHVPSSGAGALTVTSTNRPEPVAPVAVGGDVKPAQLVKAVPPLYPAIAKTQRVSGTVHLDALIDESGNVSALKVISGPTLLHHAALDAVKQWKYSPATLDGKPTPMHLTVTVQFRTQ
jgi:TonB family protein